MDGGQDGGVEKRTRLEEGGKNGLEKKSGNGETEREGEMGKMGPVVVEMSATGAAEMEGDGLSGIAGGKKGEE